MNARNESLPASRQSSEIAERTFADVVPWSLKEVGRLASIIHASALAPDSVKSEADAAIIIMHGMSLGLTAMQSLRSIHVVKGKPSLTAEMMVGLVKASPLCRTWHVVESTPDKCTVTTTRVGQQPESITWTMADARTAGLGGDNWRKYPRAMLRARASSELARMVYPDVVGGLYDTDEARTMDAPAPAQTTPAVIDATRDDAPAPPKQPEPDSLRDGLRNAPDSPIRALLSKLADEAAEEDLRSIAVSARKILQSKVPDDQLVELLTGPLGTHQGLAEAEYLYAAREHLCRTVPDATVVRAAWDALGKDKQWAEIIAMTKDPTHIAALGSRLMGDSQ